MTCEKVAIIGPNLKKLAKKKKKNQIGEKIILAQTLIGQLVLGDIFVGKCGQ